VAGLAATAFVAQRRAARADGETIRVATLPIDATAAVYYADQIGYFKRAGVDVEISTFTNGAASGAALAGGAADVGLIDVVSMAAAHSHGVPLVFLAPGAVYTKDAQTYVLLVPQTSPIKTAKDFAGKTIAVNGIKNINQIPTEAWIDNSGGDSTSVKFVEMPYPAMPAALDEARVDAAAETEPVIALTNGKYRIISVADNTIAPAFMVAGFAANTAWVKAHPDLAAKFSTALLQANKWANANRAASATILARVSHLSPDVTGRMIRAYYGERLDAAQIQPVIDATAKYGVIPRPFPASDIINGPGR
jgi:NitT/TauT family transport system substrate-binding protein